MLHPNSLTSIFWWAGYTILSVWLQRFVPGVDFLAPGIIICMQEQGGWRTLWLAIVWILLMEGMGNLPFGYGIAWYGLLVIFYFVGRWLFEARSFLFMCLLGIGLGGLHPVLSYSLARLASMSVNWDMVVMEGVVQAVTFPIVWLVVDYLLPRSMRQDVRPL